MKQYPSLMTYRISLSVTPLPLAQRANRDAPLPSSPLSLLPLSCTSPTTSRPSCRLITNITAQEGWPTHQLVPA